MTSCPMPIDEEEKKKKRLEWQEGFLTKFASLIEGRIQTAGGNRDVKSPSVADVVLKGIVDGMQSGPFNYRDANFFGNYPGIIASGEANMKNAKVKSYYDSRK